MKYIVKNEDGELIVPTYKELRTLYKARFINDDDQVRKEDSDRWVRAGSMKDLVILKPKKWHGNEVVWMYVGICVFTLALIFAMG